MRRFSYDLIISYLLMLIGIYLFLAAGYDEWRGVTHKPHALLIGERLQSRHTFTGYLLVENRTRSCFIDL